jgi:hypothetical protein
MCAQLWLEKTILERLPQDLQDVAAALGPFIQAAHPVVRERPLARQRHLAPANHAHVGDGLTRGG